MNQKKKLDRQRRDIAQRERFIELTIRYRWLHGVIYFGLAILLAIQGLWLGAVIFALLGIYVPFYFGSARYRDRVASSLARRRAKLEQEPGLAE